MSEVREGYKMTELGNIPIEWTVKSIGDFTSVKTGSTPLKSNTAYWENGSIPWMTSGEVNKKFIYNVREKITEEGFNSSNTSLLPTKTIMLAMNGQGKTRGTVAYLHIETTCNQSLAGILPSKKYNSLYLFYFLQNSYERLRGINGEGRNGLNLKLIRDFKVILPTLDEQKKIADILSTVDTQIEQTEQMIEQTKELKHGLMQQLLTKGIGHTGFKESELGLQPLSWNIGSGFINIKSGYGFKLEDYSNNGGIPLIRINNIGYGLMKYDNLAYLPDNLTNEYSDFLLKQGDILLALNRPITNGKLKICYFEDEIAFLYQRVGKLKMNIEKFVPKFYYFYLQSPMFIKKLTDSFVGSDQPFIKVTDFNKMLMPIPPIEEQQKISEILSSVDDQIDIYEKEKEKYEELKKGLMQQLLTGKIRVKVDE